MNPTTKIQTRSDRTSNHWAFGIVQLSDVQISAFHCIYIVKIWTILQPDCLIIFEIKMIIFRIPTMYYKEKLYFFTETLNLKQIQRKHWYNCKFLHQLMLVENWCKDKCFGSLKYTHPSFSSSRVFHCKSSSLQQR